eukprot:gene37576-64813_t
MRCARASTTCWSASTARRALGDCDSAELRFRRPRGDEGGDAEQLQHTPASSRRGIKGYKTY